MTDFYSNLSFNDNISYNELVQINDQLTNTIANLKKQQEEYEKCTHTVYAPGKSYKELEEKLEKLEKLEQEKNQEIDRLINTMAQANKEIQSCRHDNYNLKSRNIDLERLIQKQNVILDLAAGYISTSKRFSSTHPMDVKKWLMGGME
jgi:DNA repair ATPase RecN